MKRMFHVRVDLMQIELEEEFKKFRFETEQNHVALEYVVRELFNLVEFLAEYVKTNLNPLIQRTIHDRLEEFKKGVLPL